VRSTNPSKCVLVVASPAISLLVDAPPTLVGASSGGSSLASTMTFVAACIYGIFCPPSRSTNSGTLSVSMIGILWHWVLRSRTGRCCPTPLFCFLVVFVWGTRGRSSGSKASFLWRWSSWLFMLPFWIYWVCVAIWYRRLFLFAVFVYSATA